VWLLAEKMEDGKPFLVSRTYSASLHPQSSLRNDLHSWRGRDFANAQERRDFDLDSMIGVGATLLIIHKEGENGVFANIDRVMPLGKGIPVPPIPEDYVRHKDRPEPRFNGKFSKHGAGSPYGKPLPATTGKDREVPF
jgi:hypothetical protein